MKLVIRGNNWKVKESTGLKDDDGNECDGLCDYDNHTILIDRELKSKARIDTLVHEFFHAAIHEMHLELGAIADEMVVRGLTESLLKNFKVTTRPQ